MKLERLTAACILPIGLAEAWEFFSDPRNLERITPPSLGIEITSGLPPRMHPGMIVCYTVRPLLGIPVRWVTEITHVREPHLFVDEQRFGPYRFWHHEHRFREIPGGVECEDRVHYALPFPPAGPRLAGSLVRGQLARIFDFRREVLAQRFGEIPGAPPGGGGRP